MISVGAQELGCSHDCAWPGCPGETRVRGGYCDRGHSGEPPVLDPGPGQLAHLIDPDDPERIVAGPCRAAGCTRPPLPTRASDRFAGLCSYHRQIRLGHDRQRRRGRWEP